MKTFLWTILLFAYAYATELDIDKINEDKFKIFFGNERYDCTKKPPLSHSWSYECSPNLNNRRLRGGDKQAFAGTLSNEHLDCAKCKTECGDDYSTEYCSICIPNC